jgi:hypothetical protein
MPVSDMQCQHRDDAWTLICESNQIYGGYGFTEDYPAARAVREYQNHFPLRGHHYIQTIDLSTRKGRSTKASLRGLLQDNESLITSERELKPELAREFAKLKKACVPFRDCRQHVSIYQ